MTGQRNNLVLWLFDFNRVRHYELLFVVMVALSVNILTTDLKDGITRLEAMADICALLASFSVFSIYITLASLWEQSIGTGDAIGSYRREFNENRQRRVSLMLGLSIGLIILACVLMYLTGVTATEARS